MPKCKVKLEDFKELALIYNTDGRGAVLNTLKNHYGVQNTHAIIKRMKKSQTLLYSPDQDSFTIQDQSTPEVAFLSMEELCCTSTLKNAKSEKLENENRSQAMEKLIHELIGDRLLQLSRYISIDMLSKTIMIDKTSLENDGIKMTTY